MILFGKTNSLIMWRMQAVVISVFVPAEGQADLNANPYAAVKVLGIATEDVGDLPSWRNSNETSRRALLERNLL